MQSRTVSLDRVGVALSAVCLVHCLLTPALLTLLPVVGTSLLAEDLFHRLLLLLVVPTSAVALSLGCHSHRDRVVAAAGGLGMLLLAIAAIAGHAALGETGERGLSMLGALVLAAGHLRNYRACRPLSCHHSQAADPDQKIRIA